MARTATLSGQLRVATDTGILLLEASVISETPTVDKQIKSETVIAASATVTMNLAGITKATLIDISFTDESTGAAKQATVLVTEAPSGSEITLPKCSRFNLVGTNASAGLKLLRVLAGSGNKTIAKLIAAGT